MRDIIERGFQFPHHGNLFLTQIPDANDSSKVFFLPVRATGTGRNDLVGCQGGAVRSLGHVGSAGSATGRRVILLRQGMRGLCRIREGRGGHSLDRIFRQVGRFQGRHQASTGILNRDGLQRDIIIMTTIATRLDAQVLVLCHR